MNVVDRKVAKIALEQVYMTSKVSIGSNYIMFLIIAIFLFIENSPSMLVYGFAIHTALLLYRTYILSNYMKTNTIISKKKKYISLVINVYNRYILTGLAWGMSFFGVGEISIEYQLLLLIIIIGLSSGEVFTLGTVPLIYLSYIVPMLGISFIWFATHDGSVYMICMFLIGLSILYLFSTVQNFSKNFRQIILDKEKGKELKERMELALIGNNDGIWDWNIATDSVYFSPSWKEMLGYSNHELPNKFSTWKDRIHPDDIESSMDCVNKSADGKIEYYEGSHRLKHKDGQWIWVLDRAKTQYDDDGNAIRMIGAHTDITAAKVQQLKSTHQTQIIDQINDSVISTDLDGNIISWNNGSENLFGFTINEVKAKHISMLYSKKNISTIQNCIDTLMQTGSYSADLFLVKKSKKIIYATLSLSLLRDDNGVPLNIIAYIHDITQRKQAEDEVHKQKIIVAHQAHHDSLTDLPNRTLFNDRLKQGIEKSKRNNTKMALLFIDLDHFKEINDSLGHIVGDEILKIVTDNLSKIIRKKDTLSRFGGDEFTVIIEDLVQGQDASSLAQKILKILAEPIVVDGNTLYISSSIGISLYPDDGDSPQNLLKYADAAMYKAKKEGRNNFQFYSAEMTELAFERVVMETSLRAALKNEEFVVHYQPQVNGASNKLIGMEALVRWQHPTMGLVAPSKFIPLAESIGLIVNIDRFVMKTAMKQFKRWYDSGLNPGKLALNLAVKQLQQKDFITMLESMIEETGCKARWLELEVTESQIITNPQEAIKILDKISELGIGLAIDDFGTGYSSLSYLKRLPINKLKIDQSFVHDLPYDEEDAAIVKTVIALAQNLNLSIIAEGVEQKEQKEFLIENGCDNIQGYFYAKPMLAQKMKEVLMEGFNK